MAGKTRPSLRAKTLQNVDHSNLSLTDKECIHQVFKAFEELNTADVVEVVRCKDCKHSNEYGTICRYSVGRAVEPDHFCSYGKKE